MQYNLTLTNDFNSGELGWQISHPLNSSADDMDLTKDGRLIAHDIIEHISIGACVGGVANELLALGAVWFTRGQFGDFENSRYNAYEQIASDLDLMAEYLEGGQELEFICNQGFCSEKDDLQSCIDSSSGDRQLIQSFLPYLCKGYNLAARKYRDGMQANNIFNNIREAVNGFEQYHDYGGELHEGWEITLQVITSTQEVRIIDNTLAEITREMRENY